MFVNLFEAEGEADCVYLGVFFSDMTQRQRGANSTSANWILPKRDSDEVLFIAALIVSIFAPVHGYYGAPARSTGLSPCPRKLIY